MLNTHELGQKAPKNISYQEFFLEFIKLNNLFYPIKYAKNSITNNTTNIINLNYFQPIGVDNFIQFKSY